MKTSLRSVRGICRSQGWWALLVAGLLGAASPAWCQDKAAPSGPAPKLREVVDFPEDYVGQTLTYTVKISPKRLHRNGTGDYSLFCLDSEGSLLPDRLGSGTLNSFILPKAEARKLIVRLSAAETYEAQIRFTIERGQAVGGLGYYYIARVHSVELP